MDRDERVLLFRRGGGPGKKNYLRFTKGSKFLKKSCFLKKKLGSIAGSGWSKLDSGEVFGIFGGVNLSQGDAAVLYEGSKNLFGATGGLFLTFWPTAFSIIFFGLRDFFKNWVFGMDFFKISGFLKWFLSKSGFDR